MSRSVCVLSKTTIFDICPVYSRGSCIEVGVLRILFVICNLSIYYISASCISGHSVGPNLRSEFKGQFCQGIVKSTRKSRYAIGFRLKESMLKMCASPIYIYYVIGQLDLLSATSCFQSSYHLHKWNPRGVFGTSPWHMHCFDTFKQQLACNPLPSALWAPNLRHVIFTSYWPGLPNIGQVLFVRNQLLAT